MGLKRSEMIEYLVKKQGYNKKVVEEMEVWELVDLYEMFHEDKYGIFKNFKRKANHQASR